MIQLYGMTETSSKIVYDPRKPESPYFAYPSECFGDTFVMTY